MASRTRDERGATAILFAALALVLLGVSALAIDVGHVYAKRSALQSNVDLAVMAAAAELENDGPCNASSNPEVVATAIEYLSKDSNVVPDQVTLDLGGSAGDADGFIRCADWKVELWAPTARVEYGLARAVMDEATADEGVDVPAYAAAQIKSPSHTDTLPMYAVSGCDLGAQALTDPPPGPGPSNDPPDMVPAGTSPVRNMVITPNEVESDLTAPQGPVSVAAQIQGTGTRNGQIVFYNPTSGDTYTAGTATALPSGGGWNDFTLTAPSVPQEVLDGNGIWWVRIRVTSGTTVDWSPDDESAAFTVGDLLFCDGAVSGNFGTLRLARNDVVPGAWVETNIIKGVQANLVTNPSSVVPCSPVDSDHTPVSPTDCVSTDPGFPNEAATDGFVGTTSDPGRLRVPTTPGCDRNGGDDETATPALNDDLLTCFILGGHSVGDVVAGEANILSADIFDSPRFFYIPIIPVEAANGASGAYPIIGFRPGFITEETMAATATARGPVTGHNGIHFHSGHIEKINVVLFPESAFPTTVPPRGGEIDYTGSGTKVLVLVE